ncbi:MAG TPA: hypothetical protein VF801_02710 [Rhodocyclaceae bacterium]
MHLLVDISAHGYGHLGQTAPVLNALGAAVPNLEITVRCGLTEDRLKRRIDVPFRHVHAATDFGYVMHSAIDLDLPATARRYREMHADWDGRVAAESAWLEAQGFDAVLTNVSYLPLAGAARAGIPAAAMSSLNWLDLFVDSFGGQAWAAPVHAQMSDAYDSARMFLRVTPGLPMESLGNVEPIGPVCRMSRANRAAIARALGAEPREKWLLVAMGGMAFPLDVGRWPKLAGVRYFVPPALAVARADVTAFDSETIDFSELLASSDLVVTKPGYGTFVEAACHGRPVLYVEREGWSEARYLGEWLRANARAAPLERGDLANGNLMPSVERLLEQPPPAVVPRPTGIADAVRLLAPLLGGD